MHLKLYKISKKKTRKKRLPRRRTVKPVFRENVANLVKLDQNEALADALLLVIFSFTEQFLKITTSGRRKIHRTLMMTISTAGHCAMFDRAL